jgi:hypothetical protein
MLDSVNLKLLGLSIFLLAIGYILLGQGPVTSVFSWSLAPVILVGVYCCLIPIAIMAKNKSGMQKDKPGIAKDQSGKKR